MNVPEGSVSQANVKDALVTVAVVLGLLLFTLSLFGIVLTNAQSDHLISARLNSVNYVARQGMLAAQMRDAMRAIADAGGNGNDSTNLRTELGSAETLFGKTARAFANGGFTEDANGTNVAAEKLTDRQQLTFAKLMLSDWEPLEAKIKGIESGPNAESRSYVRGVLADAQTTMPELEHIASDLSVELANSKSNMAGLAGTRNLLTGIAVVCFLLIVGALFTRNMDSQRAIAGYAEELEGRNDQLASQSGALAAAKASTDLIMDTVTQGLMLINAEYRIEGVYSRELENIFRLKNLSNFTLLNVLQRMLSERMYQTSKDYLALLFDPRRKERTLGKINPLDQIEVSFLKPGGGFESRWLAMTFRRIVDADGSISRVFIAVSDVTERVQLEMEIREAEARKERQFELLQDMFHVDPAQLAEFTENVTCELAAMNDTLRAQDFAAGSASDELRRRLDAIFRSVHNIKGNAALLRLDSFTRRCGDFEEKLAELRRRTQLGGDDFIVIAIAQAELRSALDEVRELQEKFSMLAARPAGVAPLDVVVHRTAAAVASPPAPPRNGRTPIGISINRSKQS